MRLWSRVLAPVIPPRRWRATGLFLPLLLSLWLPLSLLLTRTAPAVSGEVSLPSASIAGPCSTSAGWSPWLLARRSLFLLSLLPLEWLRAALSGKVAPAATVITPALINRHLTHPHTVLPLFGSHLVKSLSKCCYSQRVCPRRSHIVLVGSGLSALVERAHLQLGRRYLLGCSDGSQESHQSVVNH